MIKTNLYHKRQYWKRRFDKALYFLVNPNDNIKISEHFINNINTNFKHRIDIDKLYSILYKCTTWRQDCYLFEVETEYNTENHFEKITKAVFRTNYDKDYDIAIVVRKNKVITAWLNNVDDRHFTLNEKAYVGVVDKRYKGYYDRTK